MKNTLENKAKFFTQYWGQEILSYQIKATSLVCVGDSRVHKDDILELKPLSQITDEDAIELAQIVSGDRFKEPFNKGMVDFWNYVGDSASELELRIQLQPTKHIPANTFNLVRVLLHSVYNEFGNISDGVDYLRSKGYALPYLGLSVEKMIEYGWIKLTD